MGTKCHNPNPGGKRVLYVVGTSSSSGYKGKSRAVKQHEPRQTVNLSDDTDTDEDIVPSNQLLRDKNEREEFDSLRILTQYIGPSEQEDNDNTKRSDDRPPPTMTEEERTIRTTEQHLKRIYKDQTDTMDRASNHLEALTRAVNRQRTPNKLQITITPQVVNYNDPTFISEFIRTFTYQV